MDKKQIQMRVLQDGKPLALKKFNWDEKTKTFSSNEENLVIDFSVISGATINTGVYSTIKAGYRSTIKAGYHSTINTGVYSTIKAGYRSTIKAGYRSTIKAGDHSTINAGYRSTINAGYRSTIKAGHHSTINTGYHSTINAGDHSAINTGDHSTINAKGDEIVVVNRNVFEVITPDNGDIIQICPLGIKGHIRNGMKDDKPHMIADGILSEVISKRGNVYHVINHGEDKKSYIVTDGTHFAHGATLKEAKESLIYKVSDRDTSKYEQMELGDTVTFAEAIAMYRAITGACEGGVRSFVEANADKKKDDYTIAELIDLTKGQYRSEQFKQFFEGESR